MTNTLFFFSFRGPEGSGNNWLTPSIILVMLLIGWASNAQQSTWIQQKALPETIYFQQQPLIIPNPFNEEKKIIPFNPTKDFERVHHSELAFEINVYPNPAADYVYVAIPSDGIISISCSTGKLIENHEVQEGEISIDTSHLPDGLYLVQLFADGEAYTKRVVIRH